MAITLFDNKEDCCGCGACMNACLQNAIRMIEDEYGFVYPQIDPALCIECGACQAVCGYRNPPQKSLPMACYAAAAKDEGLLRTSSSGGVFAAVATEVLKQGGVVYGVAMPLEAEGYSPKHLRVSNIEDIPLLQGSKYVQSDVGFAYAQAQEDLENSTPVLFSGTPCQIAGLIRYLGKEYENLLTMEVICHGVPSAKMFRDFIADTETRRGGKIAGFAFRSKLKRQSKLTAMRFCDKNGAERLQIQNGHSVSYMHYFSQSLTCRTSCYHCIFATAERVADLTVGDYWGFHREHPEISPKTQLSNARGVSCVMINSQKGRQALQNCRDAFTLVESQYERVVRHNAQLSRPAVAVQEREYLLELYRQNGYAALEDRFRKAYRKERLVRNAVSRIPGGAKRTVARVMGWTRRLMET